MTSPTPKETQMHEIYADFMKLDEWPGIPGQSVPIAHVADRPDLATLDGHTVILISFDLRAEGRIFEFVRPLTLLLGAYARLGTLCTHKTAARFVQGLAVVYR